MILQSIARPIGIPRNRNQLCSLHPSKQIVSSGTRNQRRYPVFLEPTLDVSCSEKTRVPDLSDHYDNRIIPHRESKSFHEPPTCE